MTPPVPILLVTGFLGAGKTTLVNHLLAHAGGRRIAAVVNDFGAINIDAELLAGVSDGVMSLPNGCICCTAEGDLLRTLAALLRRTPRPERIAIETSGVADPAGIVRTLMDPVIWREAPLETVLGVVDATRGEMLGDALLRSQAATADLLALSKTDLAGPAETARVRATLATVNRRAAVVETDHGRLPPDLLFPPDPAPPAPREAARPRPVADRWEATTWVCDRPISLSRLQAAIESLAPKLVRAKGFVQAVERPGQPLLFQLAGGRATLAPAQPQPDQLPVRLVFIAELGALDAAEVGRAMEGCLPGPAANPTAPAGRS